MDWVSYKEIKHRVTLQMVIDRYGVRLRQAGPNTLRGKCPLPTHGSKESNQSFTLTLNKGTGGAWACQSDSCRIARGRLGGNVLDFVAAMEGCSVREAAVKIQTWFSVPATRKAHVANGKDPRAEISAGKEPELTGQLVSGKSETADEGGFNKPIPWGGRGLQGIDPTHPYLRERGITLELARKFGVGFFPGRGSMRGRVVIPIHNASGELVAYAGRSIDGTEPRYRFPAGFHKSLELFNLHRVIGESSVVVVEGFFDCMKVTQAGFPCVALMGRTLSRAQEKLIGENFGQVILMLDGDDAGRSATEEIAERLRSVVYRVDVVELGDGVQPDQLSIEQIQVPIRCAVRFR